MNGDLRCHWRVVAPGAYDRFLITITNFTVNPLSNTGETMQELESDRLPEPGSKEWSKSLKEAVGLKLFDGIYSTSRVLTEHLVTDSVQPGNRPAFYVTNAKTVRIDVSYPTTTIGTIGFGYAAIRVLQSSEECDAYYEFKCRGISFGDKMYGGLFSKITLGDYCIRRELVCDNVPNCVMGEDEEKRGKSKCSAPPTPPPEGEVLDGLTITLIVLLGLACFVLLGILGVFFVRKMAASSDEASCHARSDSQQSNGTGSAMSTGNPATYRGSASSQGHSSGSNVNNGNSVNGHAGGGGRSSRHNSGDTSPTQPIIVEHDPQVHPQTIYIAKGIMPQPPLYDFLYHNKRLESVDEENETEYSNTQSEANDRAFLLKYDSGKGESSS